MDISQHPEITRISNALNNAMSQIQEAASKGDNARAEELTQSYRQLQNLYAQTENELTVAKREEQDRSAQWLASTPSENEISSIGTPESFSASGTDIPAQAIVSTVRRSISKIKSDDDIKNHLATALDIPKDQIDTKSGIAGTNRFSLASLPTPESKLEYLQKEYKPGNVIPVNISGSPSFLVKTGDKYTLADELGASVSDFTTDVAGEIGPLIGAVVGGRIGSKFGKGAGGNAAAAGAAIGQGIVSSAQDVIARSVVGLPVDYGEILKRRGVEAALSYGIDKVGQVLAKPFVKKIGENIPNPLAESISEAQKLLKAKGVETTAPIMNIFGAEALESQKERMGRQATGIGSRAGSAAQRTLDLLGEFRQKLQGPEIPLDYERIINRQKANERLILSEISKNDKQAAAIIEQNLQKKFNDVSVNRFEKESTGELIRGNLSAAKDQLKQIKNDAYDNFYSLANQQGIEMTPGQVADALESGSKSLGRELNNPEISKQVSELRLRQQLKDTASKLQNDLSSSGRTPTPQETQILNSAAAQPNLGPRDIDDRIKMAEEVVGGEAFGSGSTGASVATAAAQKLRSVRDSIYAQKGLTADWDNATKAYTDALGSRAGATGRALAEKFGDPTKTGTQVIDDIVRDPQYIRDAIEMSTLSGDPATAEITRKSLQDAYLAKLGLVGSKGNISGEIPINDDIVKSLWGRVDANGNPNMVEANLVSNKIRNLNQAFAQSNTDIKNIDPNDVKSLFSTLSLDDEKLMIDKIRARAAAQTQKDIFTGNSIIKAAQKGNWDVTDSTGFTEALFNADVGEVGRLLKRLPANVKPSVQSDFVGRLFKDYPTTAETTNATELFDAKSVLKDLSGRKGKQLESRIKEVMGKDWFDSFKAAATVMDANMFEKVNRSALGLKGSGGGTGGSRLFIVGDIKRIATDRILSGAQGLGALKPMFDLMAKKVSRETVDKNWNKALQGISGTRAGIMSLTHAVRDDPDEAQKLSDYYSSTVSQGGSSSDRFRANIGR